ncbi:hypothetical protein IVB12_08515 [Bradyrhizobium sp. 179]|uniref:hypothetical protein n=1 Tax=Bradyrhizobium sp. 179 TaxID=2782648 RepID=UPI001FFBAB3A|nr:hypothetical protein [Bradyrhizobium sp. 179]MCK1542011.1 hypothetical protein [Bradyrhizobium sp. 179]
MKPEQQEIERLRREVAKLKAERDIRKNLSSVVARQRQMLRRGSPLEEAMPRKIQRTIFDMATRARAK